MTTSARNSTRKESRPVAFEFKVLAVVLATLFVGDVRLADAFSVTAPHGVARLDSSVRLYMSLPNDDLSFSARSLSDHRNHKGLDVLTSSDQSGKFRSLAKKQQMSAGSPPTEDSTTSGEVEKPRAKYQRAEHWDADRTRNGKNGGESALAQLKHENARWEKAFRSTFLG
jgi:hypothetical protein